MSAHGEPHVFTRDEIIAGTQTPVAGWVRGVCAVLAVVGVITFIFGAFVGAHVATRAGDRFVRVVVLCVVSALIVKLAFELR